MARAESVCPKRSFAPCVTASSEGCSMVSAVDQSLERSAKEPIATSMAGRSAAPWPLLPLAIIASTILLWYGTGLTPISGLTWLAPLPLFAVATRVPGMAAAGGAAIAWLAGELNMWTYFHRDLQMPIPIVIVFLAVQAAMFAATILLYRALARRGRVV